MKKIKKSLTVINNKVEFLNFLKKKFPLYHKSNVFFRDLHYGVMEFLFLKKIKTTYTEAEDITNEVIGYFEKQKILKKVNIQGWVFLYPEFAVKKLNYDSMIE